VSSEPFRVVTAGDAALVLELPARVDPSINSRLVHVANELRRQFGPVVRDTVVGFATLTIYFDPLNVDAAWLEGEIAQLARQEPSDEIADGVTHDVPVCYGGEFGPDLADVAAACDCTEDEVIRLHSSVEYRVFVVGFVPGFAYMGIVDDRLVLPRRQVPRTRVPAGSIAIAAGQTGIYPIETPGGWHLLGRTPVRPYDPARSDPVLFRCGDRVRFRVIDRATFDSMATS
jgi:inhibitor of KinA